MLDTAKKIKSIEHPLQELMKIIIPVAVSYTHLIVFFISSAEFLIVDINIACGQI